ncbi:hypothetical protein [Peribacillus asahii]|uniref:hypothetical protein n=1 Tax=Peribacillus asahii TaxID=228899 RepID=UPI002079BB6D|nr:hypothetical protein [Peribacillus asahii]USK86180.1 hypothetical protein LIT35_05930 [Peribacillus asahii]
MTIQKVKDRFYHTETAIYNKGDVFNAPNKSIVGTKNFYITNRGRVFAHDTGGIFGEEQTYEYTGKINASINSYGVILTNYNYDSFSFNVTLDFKEFLSLYKQIPKNKFHFEKNVITPCLVSNNFFVNNTITFDQITIHEDKIIFDNNEVKTLPFFRVETYKVENDILTIFGVFDCSYKNILRIEIFIPYEETLKEIVSKIEKSSKIFDFVGKTNSIYSTRLKGYINSKYENNKNVSVAFNENEIFFVDETEEFLLGKISIKNHQFFYSALDNQLLIRSLSENKPVHILSILRNDLVEAIKKKLTKETDNFIPAFGKVNGVLFNHDYKNQCILLSINQNSLYLIMENGLEPFKPILLDETMFLFDDSKVLIIYKEEIALFETKHTNRLKKHIPPKTLIHNAEQQIGFTNNLEPFFLTQTPEKIEFKQSSEKTILSFENTNVTDISISKYGTEESVFSEVQIRLSNQKTFKVSIFNNYIKDLIYNTYQFSKIGNLPQVSPEQLFLSYSRQVNDYILYHYFGQLMALYEGLKDIIHTEKDNDVKNWKIVNYLYHTIQAQKKHFDTVSIYLPSMLEQHESRVLNQHGQNAVYQPYKNLQRGLLNITGQINRSLNEIESSISAVSFALIPRAEYDELTNKRAKRGFLTAGGMGLAGIFFPPILIGAGLVGLNTYFSKKDSEEQKRIREQNESYRLDFYVTKILDSFNHFIETLLPFYVSEVNQATFQTFQQIHSEYQPVLDSSEIKENLFNRIAQFYTFKQLPVDESVIIKKRELVELTDNTLNFANERLNHFKLEVDSIVPKSIESPIR